MADRRDNIVNVRLTDAGLDRVDRERGQVPRSECIRQMMAFALSNGFKVREPRKLV